MYILGISSYFHDSSAALLENNRIICAVAEERLSRRKHDGSFPSLAIEACLREAQISAQDISHVGIGWQPRLRWTKGCLPFIRHLPKSLGLLKRISTNLSIQNVEADFRKRYSGLRAKFHFLPHHLCHAASAYYWSGFEEAAILSIDASGEADSAWLGVGEGNRLKPLQTVSAFHSLGMVYSAVTEYLGFRADSDEWKVMGLAPYGRPTYLGAFKKLIKLKSDGFKVDLSYFGYAGGVHPYYSRKFVKEFGLPRSPDGEITAFHKDIAYAVQGLCEHVLIHLTQILYQRTKKDHLCMAGGVALNGVANGKILMNGPFKSFFGQPAAGDDGTSLGAASLIWYHKLGNTFDASTTRLQHAYLGPSVAAKDIDDAVTNSGLTFHRSESLSLEVAALLAQQKIVGWFQDRPEFGPRALGNRSILADPRSADMKERINSKVKYREEFRPLAPAILQERTQEYFLCDHPSPFMNLVYPVRPEKRDVIPAVTHADGTGRLQTVTAEANPKFYELIRCFGDLTGVPVILNTSFNVKGEPIVCSPEEAIRSFISSGIDVLVIGPFILYQ